MGEEGEEGGEEGRRDVKEEEGRTRWKGKGKGDGGKEIICGKRRSLLS